MEGKNPTELWKHLYSQETYIEAQTNCGPSTILSLKLLYKRRREKEQEGELGRGRGNSSCGKDKKAGPSGPDGTRPAVLALEKHQHDNQEFTAILRDWQVRGQPGPCETSQKIKPARELSQKLMHLQRTRVQFLAPRSCGSQPP